MKVDPTSLPTLIARMHEAAAAAPVSGPSAVGSAESVDGAVEVSPLEASLRLTAERVLAGDFESIEAIRTDVVEVVLRERWDGKVPEAKLDELVSQLSGTLGSDPEFVRQIDEMLVLAARDLGDT